MNKIFIGGLNYATEEKTLFEVFSQFGTVINYRIIRDNETGKSKGYGFVTFRDEIESENAIAKMNGEKIDGRIVGVLKAVDKKRK